MASGKLQKTSSEQISARFEAVAIGLEAIASRWVAIAIRLEAIASSDKDR